MQEINLLQSKLSDKTTQWQKNGRAFNIVLALIILGELIAGGTFFMFNQTVKEKNQNLIQANTVLKKDLADLDAGLKDARGFQAQSKNIATLLNSHVFWHGLLDEMAISTFKQGKYVTMLSDTTGVVHVEGLVASYTDLGKMLLSLETSKKFKSVRLLSTSQSTGDDAGILFSIEVEAPQTIFLSQ
jgi:Tfp pilus assembly protein PilN